MAIYAKRKPVNIVRGFGMEEYDVEGRFVRMDFEGDLTVASLYAPSGTSGPARQAVKETFLDRFIALLVQIKNEGRRVVICGDYNIAHKEIDVFDPKGGVRTTGFLPQERAWFDDVIDRVGWVDAFRVVNSEPKQYSWWSNFPAAWDRNLGWRIDYQLITPNLASTVRAASIYKGERFSDHSPVIIDYDL